MKAVAEAAPFDLCGELPRPGVTLLEASAGTGKTFTIAGLVARYVAEGVPLSEILAVTFTRMATGELRDRVRARLVTAEEGLGRLLEAGVTPDPSDALLRLLADGPQATLEWRRARLAEGLAAFDAATITTIHGFCQLVLSSLGVAGGVATGATLREDTSDIVRQVVDDLFVRRSLREGEPPPFSRRDAGSVGAAAIDHGDTILVPALDETVGGLRRRLGDAVRQEVNKRLTDANWLTYDDLLLRLRDTLADPERGQAACARLRSRYRIVLVDEFQDTDPVQWSVFSRAFSDGTCTLVLIGDPKQAIYSFRGADVYTYLDAAKLADRTFTLTNNWRSDADLLAASDALLDPLNLGNNGIPYRRVTSSPAHTQPGLVGAGPGALRVRILFDNEHHLRHSGPKRLIYKPSATEFVAADLAGDLLDLLERDARLVEYEDDGRMKAERSVAPGDVAVLVRTNRQATIVHRSLRARGIPAVVAGTENVFETAAARDWLRLLEGLEQPSSGSRAAAVAIGPWIGWSASRVAEATDRDWEEIHARLHDWGEILRRQGVAAVFRAVVARESMPGRLLGTSRGERDLTDLAHIAQLLHAESAEHQLGLHALAAWLHRRVDEAHPDVDAAEERSRRLDSDADAVQVLTVHRAKGLEFPVVYCPFLWDGHNSRRDGTPVLFHDADDGEQRKLDVGGTQGRQKEYDANYDRHITDSRGEDIRMLYVALTRAKHRVVVYWVRTYNSEVSPLGRLLLARDAEGNVKLSAPPTALKDEQVAKRLSELASRAPGTISVEHCEGGTDRTWLPAAPVREKLLAAAVFERPLDSVWGRASYSSVTASAHGVAVAQVGSEPESPGIGDEPEDGSAEILPGFEDDADQEVRALLTGVPSPWAAIPAGTEVGTFVHGLLGLVDFDADDLEGALGEALAAQRQQDATGVGEPASLVAALAAAMRTPLGPLVDGCALASIGRSDRVDELGFELPVAGGDVARGSVAIAGVADLIGSYLPTAGAGLLAGYGARMLAAPLAEGIAGYLTGSIDLVFRRRGDGEAPDRYFIADYKTNKFAAGDGELTAYQYRPAALDEEMQRAHYPLQAIFYMVALHRYLRWRLPGYEPVRNLGGALYLFLRGMTGPANPAVNGQPCGVFSWPVPVELVMELSDLFDAGRAESSASPGRSRRRP
jgi:exodeoxyribonuclease V beta subunit